MVKARLHPRIGLQPVDKAYTSLSAGTAGDAARSNIDRIQGRRLKCRRRILQANHEFRHFSAIGFTFEGFRSDYMGQF